MVATTIIGVLVLALCAALLTDARRQHGEVEGLTWVRWGPAYKAVAAFGLVVVALIIADGAFGERPAVAIVMAAAFGLLVVPVAANGFLWRVGFGASGLRCLSAWRKERVVPWSEISEVSFSSGMRQWVISTRQQGLIRINELASGSDQLIAELRRRGVRVAERPAQQ